MTDSNNEIPFPQQASPESSNKKIQSFMDKRAMDQLYEMENGRFNVANGFTRMPKFCTAARIKALKWNDDQTAIHAVLHGNPDTEIPMKMPSVKIVEAAKLCVGKYLVRFWMSPAGGLPPAVVMSKEEVEQLCKPTKPTKTTLPKKESKEIVIGSSGETVDLDMLTKIMQGVNENLKE